MEREYWIMFGSKRFSFDDFLNDLPNLHTWDGGKTWNTGGFEQYHLEKMRKIFESLPPKATFLETGAGCSTIAMLLVKGARVISIAPDQDLYERIRAYCHRNKISLRQLKVYVERSEWVLPVLASKARRSPEFVDFALIDGCHGWPNTFVDLQYVNSILRENAYLMIDDVHLHSIKEMARFLDAQPEFALALDIGKSRIYRKISKNRDFGEWNTQPYIVACTDEYAGWKDRFANQPS